MTRTLYIVTGATGEYSDYQEWLSRGFFDHAKAVAFRDALEARATELGLYDGPRRATGSYEERKAGLQQLIELDPEAQDWYQGITYSIQECPVDD